jgi:hypothetical protein
VLAENQGGGDKQTPRQAAGLREVIGSRSSCRGWIQSCRKQPGSGLQLDGVVSMQRLVEAAAPPVDHDRPHLFVEHPDLDQEISDPPPFGQRHIGSIGLDARVLR